MTPLYDVMSTQPLVDARQLQRRKMKLAMSVGDNRHYAVDSIRPRHFMQSARRAGISATVVRSVATDLIEATPKALESIASGLPQKCPEKICSSIADGVVRRLRLLKDGEL